MCDVERLPQRQVQAREEHLAIIEALLSGDQPFGSILVDASAGEHRGWEEWTVADPSIRYLRFTGLSNSANQYVCIAEWEVYGWRGPLPRPKRRQ